jgi:hypothetical protein
MEEALNERVNIHFTMEKRMKIMNYIQVFSYIEDLPKHRINTYTHQTSMP